MRAARECVYATWFRGKAKPKEVIDGGLHLDWTMRNEALFYGHLYVALYSDAIGEAEQCREDPRAAVEKYPIGHYMRDVANVHLIP